ncbi:IclR family transcriptional regulator [Sulfitobacter pontiacus]|uniref:IclR family transcriptional regulator n=1 Tax=Sulfitobacter pontiacus TaxID=60137 RepID=UPI002AC9A533|nr:IclR family transcriptional regulator [Sulfitobacter pontiacus]WPZ26334.1 IclR family transcriptional regulator [Sulfitobacter pontiacus]
MKTAEPTITVSGMPKVRAIERAVAILRAFHPRHPKMTLTEIAQATSLDKATATRILGTLIACDMVAHDTISRKYWLGFDVLSLAASVPGQHDLHQIADPILRDVSIRTECLTFLATVGKSGAVCVARAVIDPPVQVQLWNIGEVRPYNQGAGPKLLLANMKRELQEAYLANELPSANSMTITDSRELLDILERLRGQDMAFSRDDIIEGLSAQAHTIRNQDGDVTAVISVVGLNPLFSDEGRQTIGQVLAEAAVLLSRRLSVSGLL